MSAEEYGRRCAEAAWASDLPKRPLYAATSAAVREKFAEQARPPTEGAADPRGLAEAVEVAWTAFEARWNALLVGETDS